MASFREKICDATHRLRAAGSELADRGRLFLQRKDRALRDMGSLASAELALRPVQILKGFVVARFLAPEEYGVLKAVELVQKLEKFGNVGFIIILIRHPQRRRGRRTQ